MIRAYRLEPKGQTLINGLVEFERMSERETDLAIVLCQVKFELDEDGVFYYDAEVPNIIPAYGIMRLEAKGYIKKDIASELMCVLREIEEGIEREAQQYEY